MRKGEGLRQQPTLYEGPGSGWLCAKPPWCGPCEPAQGPRSGRATPCCQRISQESTGPPPKGPVVRWGLCKGTVGNTQRAS